MVLVDIIRIIEEYHIWLNFMHYLIYLQYKFAVIDQLSIPETP